MATEEGFEWVWTVTLGETTDTGSSPEPSPDLKPHVQSLYMAACARPAQDVALEAAIVELLRFLDGPNGRAHDDCWVVSNFIMPGDDHWEEDWSELPERYVDLLGILGHELWQAATDPEWAEQFGGTPKQILELISKNPEQE
jgi:hypothetical protein